MGLSRKQILIIVLLTVASNLSVNLASDELQPVLERVFGKNYPWTIGALTFIAAYAIVKLDTAYSRIKPNNNQLVRQAEGFVFESLTLMKSNLKTFVGRVESTASDDLLSKVDATRELSLNLHIYTFSPTESESISKFSPKLPSAVKAFVRSIHVATELREHNMLSKSTGVLNRIQIWIGNRKLERHIANLKADANDLLMLLEELNFDE